MSVIQEALTEIHSQVPPCFMHMKSESMLLSTLDDLIVKCPSSVRTGLQLISMWTGVQPPYLKVIIKVLNSS